jgi:outer membrane murein-binding lipoprotein Lpp
MKMFLAALAAAALLLSGCASLQADAPAAAASITASPWARQAHGADAPAWVHQAFPGKAATRFAYQRVDGRDAVAVHARASASMLRRDLRVAPTELGRLRFSWKVPALMEQADVALRDKDDAAVRVVLVFEGDRARFSTRDALLSELVRAVTGQEMPYATLMYVWCNRRAPGTVVASPRTDRIRKLVVESGPQRLNRWLEYERDIRADYRRAFGEEPGALVGVAIMTDSDNTRSDARAWYGPVRLVDAALAAP